MVKENPALELDTRKRIYHMVERFPGIHFRELQRKSGAATGELDYHLDFLEKSKLLKTEHQQGNKRFFPLGLDQSERRILGVLRQRHPRRIVMYFLENARCRHRDIVDTMELSPSSVSWYLKRLVEARIIKSTTKGSHRFFSLQKPDEVTRILIAYRESFLDTIVDRFVDSWEG